MEIIHHISTICRRPALTQLRSKLRLSTSLAKADFKLRIEGSYLGILWYLLEPALFFLTFIGIRGHIHGSHSSSYPMYLIIGLTMFDFFRNTTAHSTRAIISNERFVKSMKLPLESLVLSILFQFLFMHLLEIIIVAIFCLFFNLSLSWLFIYPLILSVFSIFTLGVSFLLATLGTFAEDLVNVWRIITRLLWLATPVFYIMKEDSAIYVFNKLNPLFHFITAARSIIIQKQPPDSWTITVCLFSSIMFFLIGFLVFEKYKIKFAEIV